MLTAFGIRKMNRPQVTVSVHSEAEGFGLQFGGNRTADAREAWQGVLCSNHLFLTWQNNIKIFRPLNSIIRLLETYPKGTVFKYRVFSGRRTESGNNGFMLSRNI